MCVALHMCVRDSESHSGVMTPQGRRDLGLRLPSDSPLSTERRDEGGGGGGREMAVKEKTVVATAVDSSGQ